MTPHTATASAALPAEPQAAATVATPIRFRPEATGPSGDVGQVFVLLVVLLGGFVALLLLARKRGWLVRWGVAPTGPAAAGRSLLIEQTLRLSARTTLYRVRDEDRTILVLESGGSAQVVDNRHGTAA